MVLTEPMLLLVAALISILLLLLLAGASKCGQARVVDTDRMVGGSVWTQKVSSYK